MRVIVNEIIVNVYNDNINPASYTISHPALSNALYVRQDDMEILVANLKVLVKQNRKVKRL